MAKFQEIILPDGTTKLKVIPRTVKEIEEQKQLREKDRHRKNEIKRKWYKYKKYLSGLTADELEKEERNKVEERFWNKVDIKGEHECWMWKGAIGGSRSGHFKFNSKIEQSHRVAYILTYGEIPEGKQINHKCTFILRRNIEMITCSNPKCKIIYRKDAPDNCICCHQDLRVEKEKESKEDQKDTLLVSNQIKCSRCGSDNLKLRFELNLHTGVIECKDCRNVDTREFVDGKAGKLTRCDWCGSTKTEINKYSEPVWTCTEFHYIDNMTLCQKCFEEHYNELEEKEEEMKYKKPVIEYMFDGDELKYWIKGDDGLWFEKIEVNNDDGKARYKRAIRKMKVAVNRKYPKAKKFIDIDGH